MRRFLDPNTYLPRSDTRIRRPPITSPNFVSANFAASSPNFLSAHAEMRVEGLRRHVSAPLSTSFGERPGPAWTLPYSPPSPARDDRPQGARQWGSLRDVMAGSVPVTSPMRSFSEALDARRPSLSAEEEAGMEARMEAERENAKSVVRTVQSTFLIAPLVVLLTLSLVLSAVQWAATLTQIRSSNEDTQGAGNGAGDSKGMLEMLVTTRPVVPGWEDSIKMPTSRLSRTLRFTLFIGLLQWFQQFLGIFPRWYLVLIKFKYSTPLKLALTAVGFPSAIRFLEYVDPHSYSRPPDRAETHAHTRTRTHARTQARTHARARAHTHTSLFASAPLLSSGGH